MTLTLTTVILTLEALLHDQCVGLDEAPQRETALSRILQVAVRVRTRLKSHGCGDGDGSARQPVPSPRGL